MMLTLYSFILLSLFSPGRSEICKCRPNEPCWPSEDEWTKLNTTVSGRLIRAVPPASVCYRSQANYDPAACARVRSQWFISTFHASDPISIDSPEWAGNSCPPTYENGTSITGDPMAGEKGCTIGRYPVYVVNATAITDVQAAVKFAKAKNINLVIKSTGHSYLGRNTGFGTLSIWTHWMKQMTYHEDFNALSCPSNSSEPIKAGTFGAGVQVYEMYREMNKYGVAMVGGASPTVGIIGWSTGGGHGPLSSDYGMGADNILEATVVLPSGEVVVTNDCQYSDLFYAIRGGGGGTYGVITSVTMRAHSSPRTDHHTFFMTSKRTGLQTQFYDLAAFILAEFPRLKNEGIQGYFGFRTAKNASSAQVLSMSWNFYAYNKSPGIMQTAFEPIRQRLEQEKALVTYASFFGSAPSFFQRFQGAPGAARVAFQRGAMGGWLLPRAAFTNISKLARTLETAGPSENGPPGMHITGHFSAPNGYKELDTGMNPAWREAIVDLIPFEPVNELASQEVVTANNYRMTFTKQQALRDLAPESGAYFNECDAHEPDFKRALFGANYDRLLSIKRKYDVDDVLWCRTCVGSDRWIEQEDGGICKLSEL